LDFLQYYNTLDCLPFLEAIEKHVHVYKKMNLDAFNNAISLPGLTKINLFNSMPRGDFLPQLQKATLDVD